MGLGAELRDMGEVLPLDPHDWFEVRPGEGRVSWHEPARACPSLRPCVVPRPSLARPPAAAPPPPPPDAQRNDFEARLRRLAAAYRIPREGSTSVRRVEEAARRILKGSEVNWHHDILAKVQSVAA